MSDFALPSRFRESQRRHIDDGTHAVLKQDCPKISRYFAQPDSDWTITPYKQLEPGNFDPAKLDGKAVKVVVEVEVNYRFGP